MSFTLSTSLMASNYAGHTKKSVASAIIFVGWAAGLIAGPNFFYASEAPNYSTAFKMLSECILGPAEHTLMESGMLCSDDCHAGRPVVLVHVRESQEGSVESDPSGHQGFGVYGSDGLPAMEDFPIHEVSRVVVASFMKIHFIKKTRMQV